MVEGITTDATPINVTALIRLAPGGVPVDTPVVIAADKDVRYEAVLNVMDELQRSGARRVGLLVQPAK